MYIKNRRMNNKKFYFILLFWVLLVKNVCSLIHGFKIGTVKEPEKELVTSFLVGSKSNRWSNW